jgi:hypothetical protein
MLLAQVLHLFAGSAPGLHSARKNPKAPPRVLIRRSRQPDIVPRLISDQRSNELVLDAPDRVKEIAEVDLLLDRVD